MFSIYHPAARRTSLGAQGPGRVEARRPDGGREGSGGGDDREGRANGEEGRDVSGRDPEEERREESSRGEAAGGARREARRDGERARGEDQADDVAGARSER